MHTCDMLLLLNCSVVVIVTCSCYSYLFALLRGVAVHLGKPSHRYPVIELPGKNGVLLKYIEGADCAKKIGVKYSTSLLLVCNRNIPVVSGCGQGCGLIIQY